MSSTAKGDAFEQRVFAALQNALEDGRLGLLPSACRIYNKKRYFSNARNSTIELDISIELFLPDAPNWSLLWAWECKDYKNNLPVDEIEEFWAKLQQVGGVNVKGGLAITGGLQTSALKYARTQGITVVRLLTDEQIEQVLYQKLPMTDVQREFLLRIETERALTDLDFRSDSRSFFSFDGEELRHGWLDVLQSTFTRKPYLQSILGYRHPLSMTVEDVFNQEDRIIVFGIIKSGDLKPGDKVEVGRDSRFLIAEVAALEVLRREINQAYAGDTVGVVFYDLTLEHVQRGMTIRNPGPPG